VGRAPAAARPGADPSFRFALGLLAFFVVLGVSYNFLLPLRDMGHWFRIFMWGTLLRLSAFGLLVWVDLRSGRRTPFDFKGMPGSRVLGHAALMTGLWALLLTHAHGAPWNWGERAMALPACLVVGLFEEYLFRGVLLRGFAERFSGAKAVFATSLLFTLFHTRLQAIAAWPHIFLTGVVLAHLRRRGMSLGHLAVVHALPDAMFFFVGREMGSEYRPVYYVFLGGLFLYAALTRKDG